MIAAAIGVAVTLTVASPSAAQVIPGVALGQSKADALRVFTAERVAPITGRPGAEFALRGQDNIQFCNGVVVGMTRGVGHDLHAFADLVSDASGDLGEPSLATQHIRTSDGEISVVNASWASAGSPTYRISMVYDPGGMDVSESIFDPGINDGTLCWTY